MHYRIKQVKMPTTGETRYMLVQYHRYRTFGMSGYCISSGLDTVFRSKEEIIEELERMLEDVKKRDVI